MIDINLVRKAGAVIPTNDQVRQAIIFYVQIEGINDINEVFQRSIYFINRFELNQGKVAKYLFTKDQFDSVIDDCIKDLTLIKNKKNLYLHPELKEKIEKENMTLKKGKRKKKKKGFS